ncbi:putative carbonic anhydrase 3 isoform X2 [Monomorium pharaonis]|uniref:putative carbonic anhydrase 3 isoform X2 n=1 Tax=Monomorium pharaonis TaxID=307658 RepID=UPI00063F4BFE|nr:putative carbonic anhydrase 3 isoform X2 [Monomorium pharaonis]
MDLVHPLLVTLISLCTGLQPLKAYQWEYSGENGPENWRGICTTGQKQSPINIVTKDVIIIDLGALKFNRYDVAFPATFTNNGHSVEIRVNGMPPFLSDGNLTMFYDLEQMHFHWSAEHTVDGLRDTLELHLVHYMRNYGNVSVAARYTNGIAVVAVLFELSTDDNLDLLPIVQATKIVSNQTEKRIHMRHKVKPLSFLPKNHMTYYHYEGSLTTPLCQESVLWFVMTEKLKVSEAQMNVFRQVKGSHGPLKFNYRPIQNLGNRKVIAYHHIEKDVNSSSSVVSNVYLVLNILLVKLLCDFYYF